MEVWTFWRWMKLFMLKNYKSGEIMKQEEDE